MGLSMATAAARYNRLLETQSVQDVTSAIAVHFGSHPIPQEFIDKLHPDLATTVRRLPRAISGKAGRRAAPAHRQQGGSPKAQENARRAHEKTQHVLAQATMSDVPWHALLGSARAALLTGPYALGQTAEQRHVQAMIQSAAWWVGRATQDPARVLEQLAADFDFPARLPAAALLVEMLTDPARGAQPKDQATAAVRTFLADRRAQATHAKQLRDQALSHRRKLRAARASARAQAKVVEDQRQALAQAQLVAHRTVPDDDRRSWRTVAEVATIVGRSSSTVSADIRKGRLEGSGWARGGWNGNRTSLHSRGQILDYIREYRPGVDTSAVAKPTSAELRAYRDMIQDTRWSAIQAQAAMAGYAWGKDLPRPSSWPAQLALRLQPLQALIDQVGNHARDPVWSDVDLQLAQVEACWRNQLAARLAACGWSQGEVAGFHRFLDTRWEPSAPVSLPWPQPVYEPALRGQIRALLDHAIELYFKSAAPVSSTAVRLSVGTLDQPLLWFSAARALPRRWVLHVGPTNSGKTHQAMEAMMGATSGIYLAPLRLLALEGFDRLRAADLPCALKTGEERLVHVPGGTLSSAPGAQPTHVSATIEAVVEDEAHYEVAVIDEAQLIDDPHRGWAWAQALAGLRADVLHVCVAPSGQSRVQALALQLGEPVEVIQHARLTPLSRLHSPVALKKLEPGDALVVFSRRQLMGYRNWLRKRGHSVAVLYGDLGPEVRRAEAERFRSGQAQILVATDAIGLGLNLPVRRVIFAQLEKFDGHERRALYKSEWEQIAGRAGRHGLYEKGFYGILGGSVGVFHGAMPSVAGPVRFRPPLSIVRALAQKLGWTHVGQVAQFWHRPPPDVVPSHTWTEHGWLARVAESGLPLDQQYTYLGAPINSSVVDTATAWLATHAQGNPVALPKVPDIAPASNNKDLARLEILAARVRLYRWCALHFPEVYRDDAQPLHEALSGAIATSLEVMDLDNLCDGCGCQLPVGHRHANCNDCFHGRRHVFDGWSPWDGV